jgi:hypothetical protein
LFFVYPPPIFIANMKTNFITYVFNPFPHIHKAKWRNAWRFSIPWKVTD